MACVFVKNIFMRAVNNDGGGRSSGTVIGNRYTPYNETRGDKRRARRRGLFRYTFRYKSRSIFEFLFLYTT